MQWGISDKKYIQYGYVSRSYNKLALYRQIIFYFVAKCINIKIFFLLYYEICGECPYALIEFLNDVP